MYKRIPKSLIVYFLFVFEDFFILRITEVFPLLDHTIGGYSGQCWGRTAFCLLFTIRFIVRMGITIIVLLGIYTLESVSVLVFFLNYDKCHLNEQNRQLLPKS